MRLRGWDGKGVPASPSIRRGRVHRSATFVSFSLRDKTLLLFLLLLADFRA
jgi:hypothetical protein